MFYRIFLRKTVPLKQIDSKYEIEVQQFQILKYRFANNLITTFVYVWCIFFRKTVPAKQIGEKYMFEVQLRYRFLGCGPKNLAYSA